MPGIWPIWLNLGIWYLKIRMTTLQTLWKYKVSAILLTTFA